MRSGKEPLLHKLRSLLEMSRRGTENEAIVATERLNHLLRKHNVSLDDIDPQNKSDHWFTYQTAFERKLLLQIFSFVRGDSHVTYWEGNGRRICFELTVAEGIEVERLYSFYKREMNQHFELAYRAFVHAQDLAAPRTDEDQRDSPLTPEEHAELKRIAAMTMGIKKATPHHQLKS